MDFTNATVPQTCATVSEVPPEASDYCMFVVCYCTCTIVCLSLKKSILILLSSDDSLVLNSLERND